MQTPLLQWRTVKRLSTVGGTRRYRGFFALLMALLGGTIFVAGVGDRAFAADAEALVQEGVALRRAGDDLAGLGKFEEANAIKKSPRTLAQMGMAEQALGRWGAASRHLRAAVTAADDPWIRKNRATIEQALKTVRQRVGELQVVGSPAGSEVRVDGELVGKLPLDVPVVVTAGSVAIEVRSPGYLPAVRSAHVLVGGLARETFRLQSTAPAVGETTSGTMTVPGPPVATGGAPSSGLTGQNGAAQSGQSEGPSGGDGNQQSREADGAADGNDASIRPARVVTLLALGLSAGALVLAVYEHVKWQDQVAKFKQNTTCDLELTDKGGTQCQGLYEAGQTGRTWTFVGYGLAGAFAATAAIVYFTTPDPAPATRTVACGLGPTALGLSCAGRF